MPLRPGSHRRLGAQGLRRLLLDHRPHGRRHQGLRPSPGQPPRSRARSSAIQPSSRCRGRRDRPPARGQGQRDPRCPRVKRRRWTTT